LNTNSSPLLTIAIPTWRRASFLEQTLKQLRLELQRSDGAGLVEVLVSDNCSPDQTQDVVKAEIAAGLPITYVRNDENIGSDANIAQCFNLAAGRYVQILGDDDFPVDGVLESLLDLLAKNDFGVVCLRPYGFEDDFRQEFPGGGGGEHVFLDSGEFLVQIASLMTLISACVINKHSPPDVDALAFCGGNLVQVHLVIRAALAARQNLFVDRYSIACKRNNSGGYDHAKVFVGSLGDVLDSYQEHGLAKRTIRAIENRLLVGYLPFYLFRQRLSGEGDPSATYASFKRRFAGRWLFHLWAAPIIRLPRPLALGWGALVVIVGRGINGDLRRGAKFALSRLRRRIAAR
jgi:abequosyltransferase